MRTKLTILALLFLAVLLLGGTAQVQAAGTTLQVNSKLDLVAVNPASGTCQTSKAGVCTLRAAIQVANALGGAVTINVPAGVYPIKIPGRLEDNAATGDFDLKANITIIGSGDKTVIKGVQKDRVFEVFAGASVTLSKLKISGGNPGTADGGGLLVDSGGTLLLDRVTLTGNKAVNGGGISNLGSAPGLAIQNSTISANKATMSGGGLYNQGSLVLTGSTISGNHGDDGAGINNAEGATATLINDTFGSNLSTGNGGGFNNSGTAVLYNVTLNGNKAQVGTALYADTNGIGLANTLIAGVTSSKNCGFGPAGFLTSLGNNLENGTMCRGLSNPPDLVGVNPKLGPLKNNGGPTLTFALLSGSPAINKGNNSLCPLTDQRGAPRPVGGTCDIGAYEFGGVVPKAASTQIPTSVDEILRSLFPTKSPAFIEQLKQGRVPDATR